MKGLYAALTQLCVGLAEEGAALDGGNDMVEGPKGLQNHRL
jgi:hypothetical protein